MDPGEPDGLVGRTAELATVRGAMAQVAAGRGRSLLIEGEPGIGKSTLLAAGLAGAKADGCQILHGNCDELGQRFPLSVMMRALGVDARSADPRRAQTAAALEHPVLAGRWSVRAISGDPVIAATEQLLELVDRLCATDPVVLAVEDLHWADDASLLLWRRLCRASVQLPLLLIGTCRPVPRREGLDRVRRELRDRDGVRIALGPLDGAGVARLAGRLAGAEPGPLLRERLEAAAGNPLYVCELTQRLLRAGTVRIEAGTAEIAREDGGPADGDAVSLAGVIAELLDFLSADARDVLRTAALLGARFSATDLAAVTGREPGEVVRIVEEALDAGVLESVGERLRFRHGLLKQALYEVVPRAVRAALHQHVGEVLIGLGAPVDRVAEILLPALEAVDGWEVDWLVRNADELVGRAPAVAAQLLEHALQHTSPADPRYAGLEDQLAEVSFLLLHYEQTTRITRGILASTTDPERTGHALWLLVYALLRKRQLREGAELVADFLGDERADPVWTARLRTLQAAILLDQLRFAEGLEAAERALVEGERLEDSTAMAYALHFRAVITHQRGDTAGGVALIDRALPLVGSQPQLATLRLMLLSNRASGVLDLGRAQEAREALRQARVLAERIGDVRLTMIQIAAAQAAYLYGSWDEATAELEGATELANEGHQLLVRHGLTALIALRRNERRVAARNIKALEDQAFGPSASYIFAARALEHEQSGRTAQAVEELKVLIEPEHGALLPAMCLWLPLLVRMALEAGDGETAEAAAEACRRQADLVERPDRRASAGWCRGLLRADPAPILAAAAYYREAGRGPDLGNALEDAAVLLAGAGEFDAARAALTEALDCYAEQGAMWDTQRAAARARSSGLRLGVRGARQRPKSGWDSLTPTELRVAKLVGRGRSNPEIAAELLLSRHTVESHVSHILAKLQVSSRREVAELSPV
jgi:DNA-binding CsgD family transcriptional regulator/tetratricopeptide (TPR) repeat protein